MNKYEINSNLDHPVDWSKLTIESSSSIPYIDNLGYRSIFNFINRKNSGSVLLSGERGAGKTTAVFHAIKKSLPILESQNTKLIPIYINYLRVKDKESFLSTLDILRLIIQGLKEKLLNTDISVPSSLDELILDLNYSEIIYLNKSVYRSSSSNTHETNISGSLGAPFSIGNITGLLGGKRSFSRLKSIFWDTSEEKMVKKIGITIEEIVGRFNNIIEMIEVGMNKKSLWSRIRKDSVHKNFKLLFIIDELDYLDDDQELRSLLLDNFKKLKNLVTLSNAQFILIVGQHTYRYANTHDRFRTLFSDRVFMTIPFGNELSTYIDSICLSDRDDSFDILKWYLISKSQHNLFNLITLIKDNSEYAIEDNKMFLSGASFNESIVWIASLHVALDHIFSYFFIPTKHKNFDSVLYNNLHAVVESFEQWVNGFDNKAIVIDSVKELDVEMRSLVMTAKKALIKYIYTLTDTPLDIELQEVAEVHLNWNAIRERLSFEKFTRGIKGYITDEEFDLKDKQNKVFERFERLVKSAGFFEADNNTSEINNNYVLRLYKIDIDSMEKATREITEKPLYERQREIVTAGLNSVNRIIQSIESIVVMNNVLIDLHDKEIPFEDQVITLAKEQQKISIVNKLSSKDFRLEFKCKLSPNSILNVALYHNNASRNTFYFARADSRTEGIDIGNGVLMKADDNVGFAYISHQKGEFSFTPGKWYEVIVEIKYNKLYYKVLSNKKEIDITSIDMQDKIEAIGFFNELNSVELKDIKLYTDENALVNV